jgi:hypothetical protein
MEVAIANEKEAIDQNNFLIIRICSTEKTCVGKNTSLETLSLHL